MKRIHFLFPAEVYHALRTSPQGLSQTEVNQRLRDFGPNSLEIKKTSYFNKFISQFTHFFAVLLWIAATLSFVGHYFNPEEGMDKLAYAILLVIVINAIFSFIQEYKAEKAIEALKQMLPYRVRVLREGTEQEILAENLVPGDVISLEGGNRVPADARLVEETGLKVNNAALTGEAEPQRRTAEPFHGERILESTNIVFAGTEVVAGSGKAVVFATGLNTEFGKIAQLTETIEKEINPLQREIIKVTRFVAFLATGLGISFFFLGTLIGRSFWENFLFSIGIIVANVPEGLLPTVTLALAMGSKRMAQRRALVKSLTAIETLGRTTVICTDKTGTLTQNDMTVTHIYIPDTTIKVTNILKNDLHPLKLLLTTAALCNNARFEGESLLGDPTEKALLVLTAKSGELESLCAGYKRIFETPFDTERKRMNTIYQASDGCYFAFVKGAIETVLPCCKSLWKSNKSHPLSEDYKKRIEEVNKQFAQKALRVLALAYRELPKDFTSNQADEELIFLGLVGMIDPPRSEVPEAIKKCHKAGIKVFMLTGDNHITAVAIAREIGLAKENPLAIDGKQIDKMNEKELKALLQNREIIFARVNPRHKMLIVSVLQELGEVVALTGDGVNDAPALKKADIGIAMGKSGTDVAKEAADMLLIDDNFATIVAAVEEGRAVFDNLRKFITYIFSSNIPEIVPYILYVLLGIPLPLTIMQILAIDLGTDLLPALALGAEKPEPGIMNKPPRSLKERLLNFPTLVRAYGFLGPMEALAGMAGYFWILKQGSWHWGKVLSFHDPLYQKATTMCLIAIIITQIANGLECRSSRQSVFKLGLFTNRFLLWGIASEIVLALLFVYFPPMQQILNTYGLEKGDWLFLIPFALLLMVAEEMRKLLFVKK
ncbi:MAG: cation-transporting P-type ATPase [Candidatus Desulfofervidaceae bacterium]|nr:cation-transporting P-type ATPase [Candidatus Desulfofervidaceae bacterium]